MFSSQLSQLQTLYVRHVPQDWRQKLSKVRTHLSMTLGAWLRAQGKLMGVTFLILTAGFFFLRVEYALLFALLITIIDALPVFGHGDGADSLEHGAVSGGATRAAAWAAGCCMRWQH